MTNKTMTQDELFKFISEIGKVDSDKEAHDNLCDYFEQECFKFSETDIVNMSCAIWKALDYGAILARQESQKELETLKASHDKLARELEIWTSDDLTRQVVSRTINENAKLKARNKLLEDGIDFYADTENKFDRAYISEDFVGYINEDDFSGCKDNLNRLNSHYGKLARQLQQSRIEGI